ncbi:GNAT family N-acetyltransferase [Vibrio breoganii]
MTKTVRRATISDLNSMVSVHCNAFDGFFLTNLGPKFLRKYYNIYLKYNHIALVYEENSKVLGFVVGSASASNFYKDLKKEWFSFLLPILNCTFKKHIYIKAFNHLKNIILNDSVNNVPTHNGLCELTSICVDITAKSKGIGSRLLNSFENTCMNQSKKGVLLTTDASKNNSNVVNFYLKNDYAIDRVFYQGKSRKMYSLVKKF